MGYYVKVCAQIKPMQLMGWRDGGVVVDDVDEKGTFISIPFILTPHHLVKLRFQIPTLHLAEGGQ